MKSIPSALIFLLFCSTACTPDVNNLAGTEVLPDVNTMTPSLATTETEMPGVIASPDSVPTPPPNPYDWMNQPVIPTNLSARMVEVYQNGLARGRDPHRFSKFGDCQNVPSLFLGIYDAGMYELGEAYSYLQPTIDQFSGSWGRESLAVKGGLNVAAVQTLYYTDPEHCELDESPMVCELRVYNPSIVIISFETWWANKPASGYEDRLRSVVEYVLSQDIVPIVATKADNIEGDYGINEAITRVAMEYELPLWNFWAAANPLPSHGLTIDGFHLTYAQNYFNSPERMQMAWPWRNLTALQAIDAVFRKLSIVP